MWQSILSRGNRIYTGTFFDSHPISNEEKRKTIEKMYGQYKKKNFAAVPEILPQELELALLSGEEVILVDCRDKNEREVGTIKGALVMDEVSFSDIETDVVLFCTVGFRSGVKGKSLMNENPNLKVKNLKGGILLWCHDVQESSLSNDDHRVHVYGKAWDLLPSSYSAVY